MKMTVLFAVLNMLMTSLMAGAQERQPLKMAYSADDKESGTVNLIDVKCPVLVMPVIDGRRNSETIGFSVMHGSLLSGKLDSWVQEGLSELKTYGLQMAPANSLDSGSGSGIALQVKLDKAYTWQVGLKIFSMVTMKASYRKGGNTQEKSYRAHGDKTNMWGAESEYVTTLNYGLNNMLPAIAEDLKIICDGGKIASYAYVHPVTGSTQKK